jgi:nucleotide-binding universal stress UspA family protein
LGSRIVLVFVVEDHLPPLVGTLTLDEREGILESQRKNAGERIEEYAAQHLAGLEVETAALAGVASQEVVRYAEGHDVDLIVMASRGYGPLRQILIGSTAERVLHHASCPVLIVPSRKS